MQQATTLYHRKADGVLTVCRGPVGPLIQLIQTPSFLVDGDDSQLSEFVELTGGSIPFEADQSQRPLAGDLVFVDSIERRISIWIESWSGPSVMRPRVDAFYGWDALCMLESGDPQLASDLAALVGQVSGRIGENGEFTEASYPSTASLLQCPAFHSSDIYLISSPIWNLQSGVGGRGVSLAVRDRLLDLGLITSHTADSWFRSETDAVWPEDLDW